jgi:predicted ATPase/DNA-binding winged helix-turn-helix (wHTH) protein
MQTDTTAYLTPRAITFGCFSVFPDRHLLLKNGKPVPIGDRALEILIALLERAGELVTKDQLVARAWPHRVIEESNLRVQVAALRRALEDGQDGDCIVAVPGRGYRFVAATSRVVAGHASVGTGGREGNLPARLTPVIGRADIVEVLVSRLRRRRFVTIVGAGGIGKTTVAITVAAELSASYPEGVWFIDLAPLADATLLPSVLAATLGLALTSHDPTEELIALLRDRRLLIILDNCERVLEAAAVLAEAILKGVPGADILATSRETLRAEGESVHRLSPLEAPPASPGLTAALALSFPAVELFVERAASSVDGFRMSDADALIVADICRQLDGIALAIELAAARVGAFGVRGVAKRLDDRFRLLVGGRRTALPRHQTLTATLDWSYVLLSEQQQAILRRLGVFAGGFTLASVAQVVADADVPVPDIPEMLSDLVDKSLVCAETDVAVARYRLLDTTRAYVIAKLSESGESAAISRRHAECFRDLFEQSLAEWQTRPAGEWLSSYAPEADNIRRALDWAFSPSGDAAIGIELTVAAIPLWFQLSSTDECRSRVEHALAHAGPLASRAAHARKVMQLYTTLGLSRTFTAGLAPQASAAWLKAFEIAQSLDDGDFRLEALWGLWFCQIGLGQYRLALDTAHKFRVHAQSPPDIAMGDRLMGVPLHCLGHGAKARGHIERSLSHEVVPVASADSIRFRFNQPLAARVMLAQMLWLEGFADRAADEAHRSVEEARSSGHAISLCDALAQAACPLAMFAGEWSAAEAAIVELQEEASGHALAPWHVLGRCWSAALQVRRGELDPGLERLASELEQLRQVRFALYHTGFLGTLAEGLAMAGQIVRALHVIDEALELCRQREELWCIAELLRIKGEILQRGETSHAAAAEQHFAQSLEHARRQNALAWELRTVASLARLRCLQGRRQEARDSLMATYECFSEGFATRDLKMAKALIEAMS